MKIKFIIASTILLAAVISASAQTTEFTYQGKLNDGANPANANYDFEFVLYDAASGGMQIGSTLPRNSIAVANGIFSVNLDFGSGFPGADRYLEIRVRLAGGGAFTTLSPRQRIASAPYAVKTLNADNATNATNAVNAQNATNATNAVNAQNAANATSAANATNAATATNALQLGGVASNQFVVTTDPRMTDARNPLPGSANYIQNGVGVQPSSNFNISGTGMANIFGAATQYDIAGIRVLSVAGVQNVFAGRNAGLSNTTGFSNSFFGQSAGANTTNGMRNSFFGALAGSQNTAQRNSFFGNEAGRDNTIGVRNAFFGDSAGTNNTTANANVFVGDEAGLTNTTGSRNSFLGVGAGRNNTTAGENVFIGADAGFSNTTGFNNSFFGANAGRLTVASQDNTFVGHEAGNRNTGSFNTFVGSDSGHFNSTGSSNSFFGRQSGEINNIGGFNSFFGNSSGQNNGSGTNNSFFGFSAGLSNSSGQENTFIGSRAGESNTGGSNNTAIGRSADFSSPALNYATAIGADSFVSQSNTVVLGRTADIVRVPGSFASVGALTTNGNLTVLGTSNLIGAVDVATLGAAGSTDVCRNASNQLSTCSSSLRYKTNVNPFFGGLDVVRRLRPITFNWRDGGMHDVGFAAEEVEKIEPLLTTYNAKGEIEGVKYGQITTVLVNAVKEQQKIIERQQRQIEALTKLVCLSHPQSDVCKEN